MAPYGRGLALAEPPSRLLGGLHVGLAAARCVRDQARAGSPASPASVESLGCWLWRKEAGAAAPVCSCSSISGVRRI